MTTFTALETISFHQLSPKLPVYQPAEEGVVHSEDPAKDVLHDFHLSPPPMVGGQIPIDVAKEAMSHWGVHWVLVMEHQQLQGILSINDILGEAAVTLQQRRSISRDQVLCRLLMTPIGDLPCVSHEHLKYAQVGHVIETLKSSNAKYLLLTQSQAVGSPIIGCFDRYHINHCFHDQVFH